MISVVSVGKAFEVAVTVSASSDAAKAVTVESMTVDSVSSNASSTATGFLMVDFIISLLTFFCFTESDSCVKPIQFYYNRTHKNRQDKTRKTKYRPFADGIS